MNIISGIKIGVLTGMLLTAGCINQPQSQGIGYHGDGKLHFDSAPREGWATDPHLSYRLYSYYPTNYYNTGFYGHYGYSGLYYH
jgi:hypothetical protein